MGKFAHDGSTVEQRDFESYAGEPPKPGVYTFELSSCNEHTSKQGNDGTEWIFRCLDEPYDGWPGWVYTNGEGALWKQDQILAALGLIEPGGAYKGTHEGIMKKVGNGKVKIRCKVKNETFEGERRAKITTVMAAKGTAATSGDDDEGGDDDSPF